MPDPAYEISVLRLELERLRQECERLRRALRELIDDESLYGDASPDPGHAA